MKKLLSIPGNSIYTKLVLTILVAVIPLYIAGLYLNDWSSKVVREEISQTMMSKVHFYMSELETELLRISNFQNEFVNDDDLHRLAIAGHKMNDIEKTASILRFRDRLLLHVHSSKYIESASVYIPSLDRYITTGDIIYDKLPESKMNQLMHKRGMFTVTGDQLHLTLAYPVFEDPPAFLLQTALSTTAFQRVLSQFSYDLEGRAYLIDANMNWSVANQAGEAPYLDDVLQQTVDESQVKRKTEGIVYLVSEGEDIIVSYKYSMLFDMYLIIYVPESQILGPLAMYRDWYWILTLISLIVIITVSYGIHLLIHRPLKKMVRAFRHIEMGNLDVTAQWAEFNWITAHWADWKSGSIFPIKE